MQVRLVPTLIVIALVVGVIWFIEAGKADQGDTVAEEISVSGMTPNDKANMYEVAKEITTPDAFINTEGVTIEGEIEAGNIVLVDFWTYSCINCQRTLPYLQSWHEKYSDEGLTIIGVHTPEFAFEEELANVRQAVEKFSITYPVVLDNDYSTWRAYNNRYWPRKYLIDIDGFIVYDHIGEGAYEATEAKIVELLNERANRLGLASVEVDERAVDADAVDFTQISTSEIYFGSDRVEYLANDAGTSCYGTSCEYTIPETVSADSFALGGTWTIEEEFARLESTEGRITLRFTANKVNLVAGGDGSQRLEVLLDGEPIRAFAGADVSDGTVTIDEEGLYNLVDLGGSYEEHTLEIRATGAGLEVFTFTFG